VAVLAFECVAKGKTPKEAFKVAKEEAQYLYGHGGYTGTIAEKDGFVMIEGFDGSSDPTQFIDNAIETNPNIQDKWGPAGCVEVVDGLYAFFGWASS
jgi:hypothetical protein